MLPTCFHSKLLEISILVSLFQMSTSRYAEKDDVLSKSNYNGRIKLNHRIQKWPSSYIFYEISHDFNSSSRQIIHQAMSEISDRTCIRFVPRNHETIDYIFIQLKLEFGCRTQIGNRGGRQYLTLDNSRCIQHGRIMHELLHSLGFSHEHQRPDRDDYIEIYWDNIKYDDIPQFLKLRRSLDYSMGFPYDYGSITHYANVSPTAAIDINKPIIRPKRLSATAVMGQRERLSPIDVLKINTLYECT